MTREELQKKASDLLFDKKRMLCQWATGTGKSGVALQFIKQNPKMNCLILVPEQNNIENWEKEFDKFEVDRSKTTIVCYASFHKHANTYWDFLVFDEAPHTNTEKKVEICRSVSAKYILALGAVMSQEEIDNLEDVYGTFYRSTITLSKAISLGILPHPVIKVLTLSIDNKRREYTHKGKKLTAAEMYDNITKKVDAAYAAYNAKPNEFNKRLMFRAGLDRKRFLAKLKEDAVKRICQSLEQNGRRFLCFCASIKQAEHLGKYRAFTSKTPVHFQLLNRFNNHEINSLYVVGKLIEGQNLKDIECGVIAQLDGSSRITVQKVGRIIRSQNPVIYIPIIKGTKDEGFLKNITFNIPKEYIQYKNL